MATDEQPPFAGFPEAAFAFWDGLHADNTKAYWTDHAATYRSAVAQPVAALAAALEERYGAVHVFRPYRDVRFSKDKTPYKVSASMVAGSSHGSGALYLQVDLEGLRLAGGYWQPTTATLARFRTAIDDPDVAASFDAERASLAADGFVLDGDELRTAPRGWDRDHPRIDLLRMRNLAVVRAPQTEPWLHTPACLDHVVAGWDRLEAWNGWLHTHVGPPPDGEQRPGR